MKIKKSELKKLADNLQIDLTEDELDQISGSIGEITNKLEEILKVDTDGIDPMFSNAQNEYVISDSEATDKDDAVDMNKINNFDGQYVKLKRGENE